MKIDLTEKCFAGMAGAYAALTPAQYKAYAKRFAKLGVVKGVC